MSLGVANGSMSILALEADCARLTARLQELSEERTILEKVRPNDLQARLAACTEAEQTRDKLKSWLLGLAGATFWGFFGYNSTWTIDPGLWGMLVLVGLLGVVVLFFWWLSARSNAERLNQEYHTTWDKYGKGIWLLGVQITETGQELSKIRAQQDNPVKTG
jgi:hypothetical protein